jgi:hypothetical protein
VVSSVKEQIALSIVIFTNNVVFIFWARSD